MLHAGELGKLLVILSSRLPYILPMMIDVFKRNDEFSKQYHLKNIYILMNNGASREYSTVT